LNKLNGPGLLAVFSLILFTVVIPVGKRGDYFLEIASIGLVLGLFFLCITIRYAFKSRSIFLGIVFSICNLTLVVASLDSVLLAINK
jgi:hypothetical protein